MSEDRSLSGTKSPMEVDTEDEEEPVDTLIGGRGKRSTAGRHMSALLNAEADDDLALLFEEVDEDNEFSAMAEDDGDDDMRMDSSSEDDEDHGPNAKGYEDEGEKELEKEARAERKKKRLQDDLRFKAMRKKVKIDPTAVSSAQPAPPRPKKKSERISWIPTLEDGPTRSSSRHQTMQNKELTHARLKDSEEKRVKLIATMEEAAKRKAHLKPKKRTQADWLAEAARVERLNSRSLNRWEETEKRKADERRAKIEALQNRRLEGPMVSYWSGIATWVDGRLTRVGKVDIRHRPKPEKEEPVKKKSKKMEKDEKAVESQRPAESVAVAGPSQPPMPVPRPGPGISMEAPTQREAVKQIPGQPNIQPVVTNPSDVNGKPAGLRTEQPTAPVPEGASAGASTQPPTPRDNGVPNIATSSGPASNVGVQDEPEKRQPDQIPNKSNFAVVIPTPKAPAGPEAETQKPPSSTEVSTQKPGERHPIPHGYKQGPAQEPGPESSGFAKPSFETPRPPGPTTAAIPIQATQHGNTSTTQQENILTGPKEARPLHVGQPVHPPGIMMPPRPPLVERTGRNVTILEDFDEEAARDREFSIYFTAKKPARLSSMWTRFFLERRLLIFSQGYRHRCVSSRRCPHDIATRRHISRTQIPMHIARSSGLRNISTSGARCWVATLALPESQRKGCQHGFSMPTPKITVGLEGRSRLTE